MCQKSSGTFGNNLILLMFIHLLGAHETVVQGVHVRYMSGTCMYVFAYQNAVYINIHLCVHACSILTGPG